MSDGATFALEDIGWIDFETRSALGLQKHGTYRYAGAARAIILAYAIGNVTPRCVAVETFDRPLQWSDLPVLLTAHQARVERGEAVWAAWNAGFDRAIWNHAAPGFPRLEPHHVIDVMAQAMAAGLPPDLLGASKASGSVHKIADSDRLKKLFCEPSGATPLSHRVSWREFMDYAAGDIAAMRSVFLGTRQLPYDEWCEYWAMEAVNECGIGIDIPMVERAAKLANEDKARAAEELFKLTGGTVKTVDMVRRMTNWLIKRLQFESNRSISAEEADAAIEELTQRQEEIDDSGEIVRPPKFALTRKRVERLIAFCGVPGRGSLADVSRLLQIRLYGGGKAPAKYSRMMDQHVDGVLKGQYVFNGAPQTGRASSKSVQIHNLVRDALPYEADVIDALLRGAKYHELATLGDAAPVARKLAMLVRPSLVPATGNVFVWSDWSQIEARVLPWLAGDDEGALARIKIFMDVDADPAVPDLYTRTAAEISHLPIAAVDKPIRQRGKVAELALGFLGGVGALQAMGAGYGVYLDDREAAEIVERWRLANQWAVNFGGRHDSYDSSGLWGAAHRAMEQPGTEQTAGRITYFFLRDYLGGSLICRLPSGRFLTYRAVRYESVPELDDDDNVIGYVRQLRHARAHSRVSLWRGSFCENVTQATAADFLRGTLRRLSDAGHCVRAHTHDEILLEVSEANAGITKMILHEVMCQGFDWSEGLPLMSEETAAYCYTKDENSHIR